MSEIICVRQVKHITYNWNLKEYFAGSMLWTRRRGELKYLSHFHQLPIVLVCSVFAYRENIMIFIRLQRYFFLVYVSEATEGRNSMD